MEMYLTLVLPLGLILRLIAHGKPYSGLRAKNQKFAKGTQYPSTGPAHCTNTDISTNRDADIVTDTDGDSYSDIAMALPLAQTSVILLEVTP